MATGTHLISDNATNHGLVAFYRELLHDTELHTCVADYLISRCVLTIDDAREIRSSPGQLQRNKILLDILIDRPYNSLDYLADALEDSGSLYLDLAQQIRQYQSNYTPKQNVEINQASLRSDLKEHSIILQKNYKSLVEGIGSTLHIVDKLFSEDVITQEDKEQIMRAELTATDQNRLILEKLIPKNKICYRKFLIMLRLDHCDSDLADVIEQTDVSQKDVIVLQIGRDKLIERLNDAERVKRLEEKVQMLETDINESIPKNIKDHISSILKSWETDNKQFVSTRGSRKIMKCLQSNNCVTVLGYPGVGKTMTTQYAVLEMQKMGYEVIPVTVPKDIRDFHSTGRRTIFVIDDLCGNYTANNQSIEEWKLWRRDIETVLEDECCKIIATCRLQVFNDTKMAELPLFRTCECNLNSKDICLTLDEKISLADLYFEDQSKKAVKLAETCDFFPLMCKLYQKNKTNLDFNLDDFLKHPFSIFENELNSLFVGGDEGKYKYCALLLCVIYDNNLTENHFTKHDQTFNKKLKAVCETCELNKGTSKLVFRKALELLIGTFVSKEHDIYHTLHDKLFDFMCKYFGKRHIDCLLDYCSSSFINERFSYASSKDNVNAEFTITLPVNCLSKYILRVITEWSCGNIVDVFCNVNMKKQFFRKDLLEQLKVVDKSLQKDIARIEDKKYVNGSALLQSCFLGDAEITGWLLDNNADCNKCGTSGSSPLNIASEKNHLSIVRLLINHGANINLADESCSTPLFVASQFGNVAVVDFLLGCNAKVNLNRSDGNSPLGIAATEGHLIIARKLIDKHALVNQMATSGMTPLHCACNKGHLSIVKMLIERGSDVNICSFLGLSPVYTACCMGNISILNLLISAGADLNKSDNNGFTPLYSVCSNGDVRLVNTLIDKGASTNTCTKDGTTPLFVAVYKGYIHIVNKLIEGGADINIGMKGGASPLYTACTWKLASIACTLVEKGADTALCYEQTHCHNM